jgi:uncharacterized membrane protein/protein-disulfide isomerase
LGLSALGLALSAYLSWHYLMRGSLVGCGGGSSCDQVLTSRWSSVGGKLPISGLAAGTYLAMLLANFFIGPRTAPPDRKLAWEAMLILSGAAAGSAAWFIIVQKWMIGAFCPYCMATHITSLLLAGLVCGIAPGQLAGNSSETAPQPLIGPLPAIGFPAMGLALAGGLAWAQLALAPGAAYRGGESQAITLPTLDPRAVPLVGSPDAHYVVILQFDYKCRHCQKIHSMLNEAIQRYEGKLAFALCPAPLNNQCNPYISRSVEEFKDSCELARLALAVWAADRGAFDAFDKWMFASEAGETWRPRTLDIARAKAVELISEPKLDAALADPWVEQFMQTSLRIYGQTLGPDQSGNAVPKLIFHSRWVTPEPSDADQLIAILQNNLAVPKP